MMRTAIQHRPGSTIGSAGSSSVRRDLVSALVGWRRATVSARAAFLAYDLRMLLTLLLALVFLAGTAFYSPAAHQLIESDASAIMLVKEVVKAPGEPTTPTKNHMPGLCTGHCAAHVLTLPILNPQLTAPIMIRSIWLVVDDQASQASRPALLERPPRV